MTFKRVIQSCVDWVQIAKRIPKVDEVSYLAFKAKSDEYMKKMSTLPAEPPKIDWSAYKNKIPVPGLVDYFQKSYEAFKIPYPKDVYSADIDRLEKEINEGIEQFKAESDVIIKECEERICEIAHMVPFGQMTFEDAAYVEPESTIDLENRPSFWPHQDVDYIILDEPKEEKEECDKQQDKCGEPQEKCDEQKKVNTAPSL